MCAAFVVVMTPDSYKSKWVRRECNYAEKRNKPLFPVLLEGEEFPRYGITQYVDVINNMLPPDDFYLRLAKHAKQQAKPGKEVSLQVHLDSKSSTSTATLSVNEEQNMFEISEAPFGSSSFILPDVASILPPPFEWCEIPVGKVTIDYSDTEQETYNVPPFAMSKYPITNGQYRVFVDAEDGYSNEMWWGYSEDVRKWYVENKTAKGSVFIGDELPYTNVSWYGAVAFGLWLSHRLKLRIFTYGELMTWGTIQRFCLLPTEQQWQRAAQGEDKRSFPWGESFDRKRCNTNESRLDRPTHVLTYPSGASPFGVMDMSGNVWEWCLTEFGKARNTMTARRVIRGGSFDDDQLYAKVTFRGNRLPHGMINSQGFRIAVNNQ